MKIKLDCYDLATVINCLKSMRRQYDSEINSNIYNIMLNLTDTSIRTHCNKKLKFILNSAELRIIRSTLIDWRNLLISTVVTSIIVLNPVLSAYGLPSLFA